MSGAVYPAKSWPVHDQLAESARCHVLIIIQHFKRMFGDTLPPPRTCSAATKCIEGRGGLRDIFITRQAIFAGRRCLRGAPTKRSLGLTIKKSVFSNPFPVRKYHGAADHTLALQESLALYAAFIATTGGSRQSLRAKGFYGVVLQQPLLPPM